MADNLRSLLTAPFQQIHDAVAVHLEQRPPREILGDQLDQYRGSGTGKSLVMLALIRDVLQIVAETFVPPAGDGATPGDAASAEFIAPYCRLAAKSYVAKNISHYADYTTTQPDEVNEFLSFYRLDDRPFGGADPSTAWAGLNVCARIARELGDRLPAELYERTLSRAISALAGLSAVPPEGIDRLDVTQRHISSVCREACRKFEAATAETGAFELDVADLPPEFEELQSQQEALDAERRRLAEESESLQQERAELEALRSELDAAQVRLDAERMQLEQSQLQQQEQQRTLDDERAAAVRQLDEQREEIGARERELDARSEQLNAEAERLERQRRELAEQSETLAAREGELAEREQALAAREGDVEKHAASVSAREGELQELAATLAAREEELHAALQRQIEEESRVAEELEKRRAELQAREEAERESLRAELAGERAELERIQREQEERERRLEERESAVARREEELTSERDALAAERERLDAHRTALTSGQEWLAEQGLELERRSAELDGWNRELQTAQQHLEEIRRRLADQQEELEHWQVELEQREQAQSAAPQLDERTLAERALLDAAESGDCAAIREAVLSGADVNVPRADALRMTPLHLAVAGGHAGAVRLLLELGADPALENAEHQNARVLAAHASDPAIWDTLSPFQAPPSERMVKQLVEPLRNGSSPVEVRARCIQLLGEIGPAASAAVPAILDQLPVQSRRLSRAIVGALKHIEPEVIPRQAIPLIGYVLGLPVEKPDAIRREWVAHLYALQGDLHAAAGRWESAIVDYEDSLRLAPGAENSDWQSRADAYAALDRNGPQFALDQYRLGTEFAETGDYANAVSCFEQAVSADDHFPWAKRELAWLLATCPDPDWHDAPRAIELAAAASRQLQDREPAMLVALAAALARNGEYESAARHARRALELSPDDPQIAELLSLFEDQTPCTQPAETSSTARRMRDVG